MALSQSLRAFKEDGSKVEVKWNDEFNKYQITRLLSPEIPVSAASFFHRTI